MENRSNQSIQSKWGVNIVIRASLVATVTAALVVLGCGEVLLSA